MGDEHKIEPRVKGARTICAVCGLDIVRYRPTPQTRKAFYRHKSFRQATFGERTARQR